MPMLVLSRKIGEKVVIGSEIIVAVRRIRGHRVTFGIEAPETVRIVRGELPRMASTTCRAKGASAAQRGPSRQYEEHPA
jgi:carbon storage regulator CsrA